LWKKKARKIFERERERRRRRRKEEEGMQACNTYA